MPRAFTQLLGSLLLLLCSGLLCSGCYSSTALVVHQGDSFEQKTKGKIVAGDKEAVYIQPADTQDVQRIEKTRIALIKHPGESKALPALTITLGLVAAIAGSIALIDGLAGDGHALVDDIKKIGGGIALGVGVLALGVGIPALIASNASESDSNERMQTPPTPPSARLGVNASLRF